MNIESRLAELIGEPAVANLFSTKTQGIGDEVRARQFREIWRVLGEAVSLWTRFEPLCDHEIARFKVLVSELAKRGESVLRKSRRACMVPMP